MQKKSRAKIKPVTKEWSIKLRVSEEEEQKIKIEAIKMNMGIAKYIKEAALEKISFFDSDNRKKSN